MGLPLRQSRSLPTVGAPRSTNEDMLSFEERTQRALEAARNVRIPDPGVWENAPVLGPGWAMAHDLQEGDYGEAAINAAMLAAELSPIGPAAKIAKIMSMIDKSKRARFLARAATQTGRIRKIEKLKGTGLEVHHTIPMNGVMGLIPKASRKAEGLWRNHPANMKILPKRLHQSVHHGFGNPYTDPFLKTWHGTNALHKTSAAAVGTAVADTTLNGSGPKRKP